MSIGKKEKIYEVNEPWRGRFFVAIQNGEVVNVDVDYVAEKVTEKGVDKE